jgi:hypothetical protein
LFASREAKVDSATLSLPWHGCLWRVAVVVCAGGRKLGESDLEEALRMNVLGE